MIAIVKYVPVRYLKYITRYTVMYIHHRAGESVCVAGADGLVAKMASMATCASNMSSVETTLCHIVPWLSLLEPRRARRALQLVRITLYPIVAIPWTKLS